MYDVFYFLFVRDDSNQRSSVCKNVPQITQHKTHEKKNNNKIRSNSKKSICGPTSELQQKESEYLSIISSSRHYSGQICLH